MDLKKMNHDLLLCFAMDEKSPINLLCLSVCLSVNASIYTMNSVEGI
jgi:hypothetical protein